MTSLHPEVGVVPRQLLYYTHIHTYKDKTLMALHIGMVTHAFVFLCETLSNTDTVHKQPLKGKHKSFHSPHLPRIPELAIMITSREREGAGEVSAEG